jgi:hypothetical protein
MTGNRLPSLIAEDPPLADTVAIENEEKPEIEDLACRTARSAGFSITAFERTIT